MVKHRNYSAEYREEAVKLVTENARPIAEVARELGLSVSRTWTLIKRGYVHLRARLLEVSSGL